MRHRKAFPEALPIPGYAYNGVFHGEPCRIVPLYNSTDDRIHIVAAVFPVNSQQHCRLSIKESSPPLWSGWHPRMVKGGGVHTWPWAKPKPLTKREKKYIAKCLVEAALSAEGMDRYLEVLNLFEVIGLDKSILHDAGQCGVGSAEGVSGYIR